MVETASTGIDATADAKASGQKNGSYQRKVHSGGDERILNRLSQ